MSDPRSGSSAREGTPAPAGAATSLVGEVSRDAGRWSRLRHEWGTRLDPAEQSALMSWGAFTIVFAGLRILTHWIRGGHGPTGGGISLGGRHFHHYNIGIALLAAVGAVGLRGSGSNGVILSSRSRTGRRLPSSSTNWRCCWTWTMCTGLPMAAKAWMLRSASLRQEPRSSPGSRYGHTRNAPYDHAANRFHVEQQRRIDPSACRACGRRSTCCLVSQRPVTVATPRRPERQRPARSRCRRPARATGRRDR